MRIFLLLASVMLGNLLHGEIQEVTLTWDAALCTQSCEGLLKKQFDKISAVSESTIFSGTGEARLRWKPNANFSFSPINTAMRMVGPRLQVIRMSVQGTIEQNGSNVTLVSLGDNTRFNLINPVTPNPQEYVDEWNVAARQLSPELRDRLLAAASRNEVVTIKGPLFMPERSPPLNLVVQSMSTTPAGR